MDNEKNAKQSVGNWRRRLRFSVAVSAALAFTLCFFGPLDLFFNNYEQIWFHLQDLLSGVALVAVALFVLGTLVGTLLRGKLHSIFMALMFGGMLGTYIQGSFMNLNYGTLNGKAVDWSSYISYGVMNTAVWAVCILLPLIFMLVFKEKKVRPVLIFLSCALIFMQGASLLVSYFNYPKVEETASLSTDGLYTLSKKDNTIVFILDTLDESYFQELVKDHPEYTKQLNGFVSYDNALASGARTPVALPLIMTGIPRTVSGTFAQYIDYTWKHQTVFNDLKRAGYDTRLFTDSPFVSKSAQDTVDNLKLSSSSVGNYPGLIKKMYKLTLYKYVPHFLKWRFWMYTGDFDQYMNDNTFIVNDAQLYKNYQKNDGFTYTDQEKCFRLYHLFGSHRPYTLQEDGTHSNGTTSLKEQTDSSFKIVLDMLQDLKENGVYDNANIFIIADHGDQGQAQHAACLYKASGETDAYSVNSAPISFLDLPATFDAIAGGDASKVGSGMTLSDSKEGDKRTRTMYLNIGTNATFITGEYQTTGSAADADLMKLVHQYKVLDASNASAYTLGTELSFASDKATANVYCTHGFRTVKTKTTRMEGRYAQMVIPIKNPPDSGKLRATLECGSVITESNMMVSVGGEKVFAQDMRKADGKKTISFEIPASSLKEGTLTLDFTFADIPESEEDKDAGTRTQTVPAITLVITAED